MYKGFWGGGGRFEDTAESEWCAVGYTSGYTSGDMVDSRSGLCHATEASAVLKALAGVDRHDGEGEFGLQFVEDRFACTGRYACDGTFDDSAYGVSFASVRGDEFIETRRVGLSADLDELCMNAHSLGSELLFGNGAGYDTCGGLSCGGSAASTPIADAVFLLIDFVGMSGAVGVAKPFVVFGACVFVADEESNRGAEGDQPLSVSPLKAEGKDSGEPLDLVGLADGTRRDRGCTKGRCTMYEGCATCSAVEFGADEVKVDMQPCGYTVEYAADSSAMTLAERGKTPFVAERVHEDNW